MIQQKTLSNGIRIIAEKLDYYRTCSFGIWVQTGSAYENEQNNGIAHIIEHMLFKSTINRNAKEIANCIARIGDDVNAYTSKEYTTFYGSVLKEDLKELVELFADMFLNSLFTEEDISKEKDVIMDEIDMYNDSPEDLVHEKLQEAVWAPHPLSYIISGEKETVQKITRDELLLFMNRYYTGNNIILSIAGNYDDSVFDLFEASFHKIPKGESREYELTAADYHGEIIYIKKKLEQLHINLAYDAIEAGHEQRFAAAVLNSALGGSNNSLMFQIIREELGLAYSVYSYPSSFRMSGLFHIDITVNPKQAYDVIKKTLEIVDYVKDNGISEEELEIHKRQVMIEFVMGNETAKDKMSINAKDLSLYGNVTEADEVIRRINAVTKKDITDFAENYLNMDRVGLALVGTVTTKELKRIAQLFGADEESS